MKELPFEIVKKILSFMGTYILFNNKKTLLNIEYLLSIPKKIHDTSKYYGYSYVIF